MGNFYGPIAGSDITVGATTAATGASSTALDGYNFFGTATATTWDSDASYPLHKTVTPTVTVAAGNILVLAGRRYKVKEVSGSRYTLTEKYAGGALITVCSGCVTAYTASTGVIGIATSTAVDVRKNDRQFL